MNEKLQTLQAHVEHRTATVGVIGLGYVGLPLACVLAETGFTVIGVDVNLERLAAIREGRNPIAGDEPGLADLLRAVGAGPALRVTSTYGDLAAADVVMIAVETPVGTDRVPRYEALRAVCRSLGPQLKEGALVIVESSVAPRTVEGLVAPLLEEHSGRRTRDGFFLGHCPERVMPGRLLTNMRTVSRVVGGQTPDVSRVMVSLYGQFVRAELKPTDILTAELVKTVENAYRDVNIAFANEVARICDRVGGDVWKVRDLVNMTPTRQMHLPGGGVGGHCIPKDPWLLASALGEGAAGSLLATARRINDSMPSHVAQLTLDCLREGGRLPSESTVVVLGYAYLQDSDDTRNSPSAALLPYLDDAGCDVRVHDPFVREYQGDVAELVRGADCLVVMVAHSVYRTLDLTDLAGRMRQATLVDARDVFTVDALERAGFAFRRLGVGPASLQDGIRDRRPDRKPFDLEPVDP